MKVLFVFNTPVLKHGSFEDLMLMLGSRIREIKGNVAYAFPRIGLKAIADELGRRGSVYTIEQRWPGKLFAEELLRIVQIEQPDVINMHFCDRKGFLPIFLELRRRKIKLVYHYHGEITPLSDVAFIKRFLSELRLVTMPVHRIITVSRANAAYLEHKRVFPKIQVIHNGIDLDRFSRKQVQKLVPSGYEPPSFERYILYIGTMVARKRIDFLLKAFSDVCGHLPEVGLVIVGGGGDAERYVALTKELNLEKRVVFTGLLEEYPYNLLTGASLLVSASKQESFGLVFAEALALGIPVVACRIGGIPEVVRDEVVGLLAEPYDRQDFANKIACLLNDIEMRERFSAQARPWIRGNFDLRVKVNELVEALEQVVRE